MSDHKLPSSALPPRASEYARAKMCVCACVCMFVRAYIHVRVFVLRVARKISDGIIISYVNYALIYYPAQRDVLIIILPGPRGQLEK